MPALKRVSKVGNARRDTRTVVEERRGTEQVSKQRRLPCQRGIVRDQYDLHQSEDEGPTIVLARPPQPSGQQFSPTRAQRKQQKKKKQKKDAGAEEAVNGKRSNVSVNKAMVHIRNPSMVDMLEHERMAGESSSQRRTSSKRKAVSAGSLIPKRRRVDAPRATKTGRAWTVEDQAPNTRRLQEAGQSPRQDQGNKEVRGNGRRKRKPQRTEQVRDSAVEEEQAHESREDDENEAYFTPEELDTTLLTEADYTEVNDEAEEGAEAAVVDSEGEVSDASVDPLAKHRNALRKIYTAHRMIGVNEINGITQDQNLIELRDPQIKDIQKLCKKLTHQLRKHTSDEPPTLDEDPAMLDLRTRVLALGKPTATTTPDFTNTTRATDIYSHAIPSLVRLLHSLTHLPDPPLPQILTHTNLILTLCTAAGHYNPRPPSHLKVILPVKRHIELPLRAFSTTLSSHLSALHHRTQTASLTQHLATLSATQSRHSARRAAEWAVHTARRRKWLELHALRRRVEGRPESAAKDAALRVPGAEVESDDLALERAVQWEMERVLREDVWEGWEMGWLVGALERFGSWDEGEMGEGEDGKVLERVVWEGCRVGGYLRRFNVTQIVVRAALIRAFLMGRAKEEGVEVEEWVRRIPVWTEQSLIEQVDG